MLSLNARIALSASIVLAIFVILTGLALDQAFHDSARSARQDRLLGQVYLLMGTAEVDAQGRVSMPSTLPESKWALPGSELYAYIADGTGSIIWRSPSALGIDVPLVRTIAAGEQRFVERKNQVGRDFYVQSFGVNWAVGAQLYPFTFMVAEDLSAMRAQLSLYRHSLWGWLGAMALLLLLTQVLMLRWGLKPLRRVAQELIAIESGKQERVEGVYPLELKRLTDNLNVLLKHERDQQKRYRDALADLAHSLKTPLAVVRGALTGDQKQQPLATAIEEEVVRMDRIIEYQLGRAATAGPSRTAASVAVKPLAAKLMNSLQKVYIEKAVAAQSKIDDSALFHGDEGDLTELLGNVLDNAFKWCRKSVRMEIYRANNRMVITIEDDGPGIGKLQVRHILERGVRADEAVPGHGIGLAIVQDIVLAYGGSIEIGRSTLGGAAVVMKIPN